MEFSDEIRRTAQQMIERHGADAAWYAERRMLELTQENQPAAAALWAEVLQAIALIQGGRGNA